MSDETDLWSPFGGGRTVGSAGSEGGTVLRDEEHADGARITLERGAKVAPFAITCGIYGWMLHTRWFSDAAVAQRDYDAMKMALGEIVQAVPFDDDPDRDAKMKAASRRIGEFVARFP